MKVPANRAARREKAAHRVHALRHGIENVAKLTGRSLIDIAEASAKDPRFAHEAHLLRQAARVGGDPNVKKETVLTIHPQGPTLDEAVKAINAKLPAGSRVEVMSDEVTPMEKQALFEAMADVRKGREQ